MPAPMEVERVSGLSRRDFRQLHLLADRPVLITDVVTRWPAFQKWNREYLSSRFGKGPVRISYRGQANDAATLRTQAETYGGGQTLARYFDLLDAKIGDGKWYVHTSTIRRFGADLASDLGTIPYVSQRLNRWAAPSPYLWIGPGGVETRLHYDNFHNFVAQIAGSKKWTLFPKEQRDILQLFQKRGENVRGSPVDIDLPDLSLYPEYERATPWDVIVGPGDLLFVPADWPHRVITLDFSITVNFFTTWMNWKELQRMAPYVARHTGKSVLGRLRKWIRR